MARKPKSFSFLRLLVHAWLSTVVLLNSLEARVPLRGGPSPTGTPAATPAGSGTTPTSTAPAESSSAERLTRTKDALEQVRKMQQAARGLSSLTPVDPKSWNKVNGLKPSTSLAWTGATIPVLPGDPADITITQTQQQAILNWETFNIGKDTTLNFDQSKGGANVSQWIAFNKIGVTGSPSQILGKINTIGGPADAKGNVPVGGQVYIINPNGVIFGGSAVANTHALVASALPINDNLIQRGLLNNPDSQFLFSALPQSAGKNGTPAFVPVVIDEFVFTGGDRVLNLNPDAGQGATVNLLSASKTPVSLIADTDYTLKPEGTAGKMKVSFTAEGLKKIPAGTTVVQVAYTPTGDQYGKVEVQAGAQLTAPTNADHVGGRVALIGKNVSNAGTISTPDGQAILAAGLQVAFAPHNAADPTLRGLDVFIGAVDDPATETVDENVGTVTNERIVNADKTILQGLIEAPRGAVTLTGKTVNQNGFIESSTSVAYNGRVDLVAGFNAVANPKYNSSLSAAADFTLGLPFIYQSNVGNDPTAATVENTGRITLGEDGVVRIIPESTTDRAAGDLALPSQVNIQGQSVHFEKNALILAPGAAVPINRAYGFDGRALEAGVSVRAGSWFTPLGPTYNFVHSKDSQQIYIDQGAAIDVAGSAKVAADVSENIVSVELRGSELANSPLQRDGPLRGQTIQVDLRQHGPWDQTMNGGLGGYTWVGTPLADTSGWVGLATHSVEELTVNGGSVALKAGGAVVLHKDSTVDVSGGSINFKADETRTTKVSADGHIYDISQATPDRVYDAVYSGTTTKIDPKWGVTETTTSRLAQSTHEDAYTQGGNGGSLAISAPVLALDGILLGNTKAGAGQRSFSALYKSENPPDPAKPSVVGAPGWLIGALSRPIPGQFSLTIGRQYQNTTGNIFNYSPTPANIVFTDTSTLAPVNEVFQRIGDPLFPTSYLFPAKRKYELDLSSSLFDNVSGSGFGIVKINNDDDALGARPGEFGNISVKAGTALDLAPGGSLTLGGGNISVEQGASITAGGGSLTLNAYGISSSVATLILAKRNSSTGLDPEDQPIYNNLRGNIVIGTGATLSVAGGVIDDRRTAGSQPLLTKGGTISLKASDVTLQASSTLNVSGGAAIGVTGKITYGDAGSITLQSGKDLNIATLKPGELIGGRLKFTGATLQGYAGVSKKGGSLTLQAPSVLVGNKPLKGTTVDTDATGKLSLEPEFFGIGGFETFSITGLGVAVGTIGTPATTPNTTDGKMTGAATAFTVAASTTSTDKVVTNTVIQPRVQNWEYLPGGRVFVRPEGSGGGVSLEFKTGDFLKDLSDDIVGNNFDVVLGAGAVIAVEPGGKVALSGGTVDVQGRIIAKGGTITVTQTGGASIFTPALHFGTASVLDTSGATAYKLDPAGNRYKSDVLDGGKITITGNIVAEKGSGFNVSGASDTIQLPPGQLSDDLLAGSNTIFESVKKDSNGGTLTLKAKELLFTAATLQGASGGSLGRNGDLVVASTLGGSDLFTPRVNDDGTTDIKPTVNDPVLILSTTTPDFFYNGLGKAVTNKAGGVAYGDAQGLGMVRIGAESFSTGGFGGLNFNLGRGALQVQGPVALTASRQIKMADSGVISLVPATGTTPVAAPSLSLVAPSVVLGQPFQAPNQSLVLDSAPVNGDGSLTVRASSLIDIGNLVLRGAGKASFDATNGGTTNGSIRGNGTLDVAGAITLKAGQIYPPTGVAFNIIADDYAVKNAKDEIVLTKGSVTIQSSGNTAPLTFPLSAGGELNIFGSTITQGGTLRAPLGKITLGANDNSVLNPLSGASLPVASALTLEAGSVTSVSAVDPVSGKPVTIPYGINVNGDTWISPGGLDITNVGPNAKSVMLTASSIDFKAATATKAAANVDLSGGGDLSAYQFVPGTGGKIDILLGSTAGTFAIVPGYTDLFPPDAPFSTGTEAAVSLANDPGYVIGNPKLAYTAGDRVHIDLQNGKGPQDYTLLPARYALLPGAFLLTPQSVATTVGTAASATKPDGSVLVSGYQFNGLDPSGQTQNIYRSFEVAPQAVVLKRAEYKQYSANKFFTDKARSDETVAPRLPVDAGQLGLAAGTALRLKGSVLTQAATGGRGGLVDISSSSDIVIGSQAALAKPEYAALVNTLLLEAKQLSSFGAESLLLGGERKTGTDGTLVTVKTNRIDVDNAGEALTGPDVILVSNQKLTLKEGAEIGKTNQPVVATDPLRITGTMALTKTAGSDSITVDRGGTPISFPNGLATGNSLKSTVAGTITTAAGVKTTFAANATISTLAAGSSITLDGGGKITATFNTKGDPVQLALGDGALVRVSSDPAAQIVRTGVASSTLPTLTVGAGVKLAGGSAILDSTRTTNLASKVDLSAVNNLSVNSGRVSVLLDNPGTASPTDSLVLSREAQTSLFKSATSLSVLSYSTLDLYGTGTFGSADLGSLALHAGAIRGFPNSTDPGASVTVAAKSITLDNAANANAVVATGTPSGTLTFDTGTLRLGGNQLDIQNFDDVKIKATGGILAGDTAKLAAKTGGLTVVGGDLTITTPLLAGASATDQSIKADGILKLISSTGPATVASGLGAKLSLTGESVDLGTAVKLPSGTLTMTASTGDLKIAGGTLDVSGTTQQFYDVTKYTDGGNITLTAEKGDMKITAGSKITVAANTGGGSAGTLNVSVPSGSFDIAADTLSGKAGTGGNGGAFSLDTIGISGSVANTSQLATLSKALGDGGFDRSVAVRVREGNVVADGTLRAHEIALAADKGKITVTGILDASGFVGSTRVDPFGGASAVDPTGGKIDLSASGDVVLTKDAWLTAAGYAYSNAGKGGAISLSAGSYTGTVDTTAKVEIQDGSRLDLGVLHAFTPNDLFLRADQSVLPVSNRTDFSKGTLHVRESQAAFGNGTQFSNIDGSVYDASGIVLEGFQVFDLTKTDGTVSTVGAITSIGSGGLIDSTVEKAVKDNGTAFVNAASPALLGKAQFHVQPGAEIVNNVASASTVTRNFVTLNNSVAAARSAVNFNLKPGNNVFTTVLIPGGLPVGIALKTTQNRQFTLTTADGVTSNVITAGSTTTIASASVDNPIVAVNFRNTGNTTPSTVLNFDTGFTPVTVAFDAVTTITSNLNSGRYSSSSGDLTLANTWDLSAYRFGAGSGKEPGNLTLRAKGNLVFGFDASLSDGFDPANAVDSSYSLWTAPLMSDRSWSYRLAAGADYSAADSQSVQSLGKLGATTGSVLLGQGSQNLPVNTVNGKPFSRKAVVPQFFQSIRTGTGNIDIAAGRDVQLLNPLATIYTAGRKIDPKAGLDGFDVPMLDSSVNLFSTFAPYYSAQYSLAGGDVSIRAQQDVARYVLSGISLVPDSTKELPSNWLYRRGSVGPDGKFLALSPTAAVPEPPTDEVQSTSWWIDFSNFFADTGALGGGNVTLSAGGNVSNVSAAVPTNARMPGKNAEGDPVVPDASKLIEFGGGDVTVRSGADIGGGVYYVERGVASIHAARSITTNSTRNAFKNISTSPVAWLPTTFFLGKGRIDVAASRDILLGSVANPFWQPQGVGNRIYETSYFSTFDTRDQVNVASLGGTITLQTRPNSTTGASLTSWYAEIMPSLTKTTVPVSQPWLSFGATRNSITPSDEFQTVAAVMPASFKATAFTGDIDIVGQLLLAPSPNGTLDLLTAGNINGVRANGESKKILSFASASINLSDADPSSLPSSTAPISNAVYLPQIPQNAPKILAQVDALFVESGRNDFSLEEKLALHGQTTDASGKLVPLHYNDREPVRLYAGGGDISGLTLYSGKSAQIVAKNDITDVALYVQNVRSDDKTVVAAGRDIIAYDPTSPLRIAAQKPGNSLVAGDAGATGPASGTPTAGDIQIAGPGTLQVLAGRNLDLGNGSTATKDGTAVGITSVGAARNPNLPQNSGAGIVAAAGVGTIYSPAAAALGQKPGLAATGLNFTNFVNSFLNPDLATASAEAARYLPELAKLMGFASKVPLEIWTEFGRKTKEEQAMLVLDIFQLVLRNAARDRNNPASPDVGTYKNGFAAVAALFPGSPMPTKEDLDSKDPVARPVTGPWAGQLSMSTRLIKTSEGGAINLLVPGGDVTVGRATDPQKPDQGVLTERGGGISIFAADSVNVGTSRIFTLRGGNEILWSTWGNIAAGSGSKTVFSAPPTRVLIDPQSGDVQNDLAGLATGSGIGVLATLSGVKPGDVDLIAPVGTIDAGDAGIRSSGNLNIAARVVLNAANIQVGGSSAGTPPPPPAATPPSAPPPPAETKKSDGPMDQSTAKRGEKNREEVPSLIMVEVLGYGGGDDDDAPPKIKSDEEKKKEEEEEAKKRKKTAEETVPELASL